MRNIFSKSLPALGAIAVITMAAPAWKPLFNGTNLNGWYIAGAQNYWTVDPVDSAIVGFSNTSTPYTMVFSDSSFDQFTIKYSYRLKAGCSGFFFRSQQTSAQELVKGIQVEAKYASGKQSEVGSLYMHPAPGWMVQHSQAYSDMIAKTPNTQYQNVILTVKRPNVYVNVNGYQAVGETELALLTQGAKAAWLYVSSNSNYATIQNPGKFGLQIHGSQPLMDVRFKDIAILQGCSDSTSANFGGATIPAALTGGQALTKQPAVYADDGSCGPTSLLPGGSATQASLFIGTTKRVGSQLIVPVLRSDVRRLEIVSLNGRVLFAIQAPSKKEYRIPVPNGPGLYIARIQTDAFSTARKIAVP